MIKKFLTILMAVCVSIGAWAAEPETIQPKKLPHLAQKIIAAYFVGDEVAEAHKEKSKFDVAYDAKLASGAYLTFDKQGNWTSVVATPMPKRIIPGRIINYFNANGISCDNVVALYHDRSGGFYLVNFADGTTLSFDEQFNRI